MARQAKIWWDKQKEQWTVWHCGKRVRLGKRKKEAQQLFHELMAKPKVSIRSDSVTVMFDLFLDWCQKNREERTYQFYLERLQAFCRTIPDLQVNQLKPHHVQSWVDTKKSDGHKRGCIKAVERALTWAKKQGYIDSNPIAGMEKPEAVSRDFVIRAPLYERVLALCSDQEFHDLLVFSWETGARPQETAAAEARHFEAELSRLHFPKHEAKGKKKPRYIYLTDQSLKIVMRRVSRYSQGILFRNSKGKPWHRNNVNCRFQRMQTTLGKLQMQEYGIEVEQKEIDRLIKELRKTKTVKGKDVKKTAADLNCEAKRKLTIQIAKTLAPKLCLYNFRHSFGTRLLESGIESMTVAALMGHSDLSMLGRVYAHLLQNPQNLLDQLKRAS